MMNGMKRKRKHIIDLNSNNQPSLLRAVNSGALYKLKVKLISAMKCLVSCISVSILMMRAVVKVSHLTV